MIQDYYYLKIIMFVQRAIPAIITTNSRANQQRIFSLLKTCISIKQLTQIHAQIIINGFSQKNFLLVQLNSLYITYGYFQNACKVFDELSNPSTNVWNQMIRGYAQNERPYKSMELYSRMLGIGSIPDEYTYSYLISACSSFSMLREGEQIHGRALLDGYYSNSYIRTNLMNLYLGFEDEVGFVNAYKVFEEMPERNSPVTWNLLVAGYIRFKNFDGAFRIFNEMPVRNVVTWTTMLTGCARNGWFRHALLLFHEMRRVDLELDQTSLVVALSVCAELGDLSTGKWIHLYVIKAFGGMTRDTCVRLQNGLIHMYASCGVIDEAYRIFNEMPSRTVVSWTTMVMGFAKHGFAKNALEVFEWMQKSSDVNPDATTFLGVLLACSHGGYVKEGRCYFKEMEERWSISLSIEHYGCFIDLLSRAGFLEEARRLIENMPMKPNAVVWGALLCGCTSHRNPELASYAAHKLILEVDQEKIVDHLVSVSNVYAMARRWQEVATVRKKMIELGSRHIKGKSWVQVDRTVHEFGADDTTHGCASSIYEMLNGLSNEIRREVIDHGTSEGFVI